MHRSIIAAAFLASGCPAAECPAGFAMDGASGLCLESGDTADTGDSGDTGLDTDTGADTDTGGGDTGDTDTGGDTADADTGTAPICAVATDGTAPYTDIQDAIDDASDGDVIYICAGTYDYVEIDRTDVSLVGIYGAISTIIDGGTHTAVTVDAVTVAIEGLTLTGTGPSNFAGGLQATDAVVTITGTRIAGCSGDNAVDIYRSESTWEDVVIEGNDNFKVFVGLGDGAASELTMTHTRIVDNVGVPLYLEGLDVIFANNIVANNEWSEAQDSADRMVIKEENRAP